MFGVAVALTGLISHCEWRFVMDTTRLVGMVQPGGTTVVIGKLDESGEFKFEQWVDLNKRHFGYDTSYIVLNGFAILDQKVLEYRSGSLVPGVMSRNGRFVPTVGGVITRFTERRLPNDPPIWNLPGYFKMSARTGVHTINSR